MVANQASNRTRFKIEIIKPSIRNNIPTIITNNKVPDINSIFTWEEVEHPVMKGIDILGRPFIIIKMIIKKIFFLVIIVNL